ncbi:hypothetical protein OAG68_01440 [bacterium]|nr:hypothetical protein [bacterium]
MCRSIGTRVRWLAPHECGIGALTGSTFFAGQVEVTDGTIGQTKVFSMKTIDTIGIAFSVVMHGLGVAHIVLDDPPLIHWLAFFFLIVGIYLAVRASSALQQEANVRKSSRPPRAESNATPFSDRLACFTRMAEGDPKDFPHVSKMPFWSANIDLQRCPAKPVSYIRRILQRIRNILTNSSC